MRTTKLKEGLREWQIKSVETRRSLIENSILDWVNGKDITATGLCRQMDMPAATFYKYLRLFPELKLLLNERRESNKSKINRARNYSNFVKNKQS